MADSSTFFREPYRPFFLIGWIEWIASFALWTGWRLAIARGTAVDWRWETLPTHFHTQSLIEGVIAAFVLGFLLTAFPKQNESVPISGRPLGALALLFAAARILFWLSALGVAPTAIAARVLEAVALVAAWIIVGRVWLAHGRMKIQPSAAGMAYKLFALGIIVGADQPLIAEALLWIVLPTLILSLGHRIFPFFASKRLANYDLQRGPYFLHGLLALQAVGLAWLLGLRPNGGSAWIGAMVHALILGWLIRELIVWKVWRFFANPMLAVLALGLIWMSFAYALGAWEGLPLARPGGFRLEKFHAMGVGAIFTLLAGIAVRVSKGHAGLPPVADRWAIFLFALIQLAVIVRLLPGLFPNLIALGVPWDGWPAGALLTLAGLVGLARFGPLLFVYRTQ